MFTARLPFVPGVDLTIRGTYAFRCPVCARVYRQDDRYEPLCTGPTWRDDHEPTVMIFAGARDADVYTSLTLP